MKILIGRMFSIHPPGDDHRAKDHAKGITKQNGQFSSIGFPQPEVRALKKTWVTQRDDEILAKALYGLFIPQGYIRACEKGFIEVSALWAVESSAEVVLGLFLNDEKTPCKKLSTLDAELIDKNYGPRQTLYRFYRFYAKDIEVSKGDRIYFKQTKWALGHLLQTTIDLKPEGRDKKLPYYYDMSPFEAFVVVSASRAFSLFLPEHPQHR